MGPRFYTWGGFIQVDYRPRAFMKWIVGRGQGLVEYALLILLVGLAVILMLTLFGAGVGNMFSSIIAEL
jgi:Flp pilus assembly pilin Flp